MSMWHSCRTLDPEVGLAMRWPWSSILSERQRTDLRTALLFAPFGVLLLALLAVKTADSSSSFEIDNRAILASLKQRIEAADVQPVQSASADLVAAKASIEPATLREVREVVRRGDTLGGILRRV